MATPEISDSSCRRTHGNNGHHNIHRYGLYRYEVHAVSTKEEHRDAVSWHPTATTEEERHCVTIEKEEARHSVTEEKKEDLCFPKNEEEDYMFSSLLPLPLPRRTALLPSKRRSTVPLLHQPVVHTQGGETGEECERCSVTAKRRRRRKRITSLLLHI